MNEQERAKKSLNLVCGQILPRLPNIIKYKGLWATSILGLSLAAGISHLPVALMNISALAAVGLSFASISLGACFTTAVLTLSLPGNDRLRKWSNIDTRPMGSTVLSDLLFVVVWAALIQVLLICTCAIALVFGGDLLVFPATAPWWQRLEIFWSGWVFFYAVTELGVVISTLSQVGSVIIHEERKEAAKEKQNEETCSQETSTD
ncbi:MAG: hypothetical protein Q4F10_11450 [Corynebacterium glutamicum]|nr:hypothetical protein [Corynebacterium glutamicum]